MTPIICEAYITAGGFRFAAPDQAFDSAYFGGVGLVFLLGCQECSCSSKYLLAFVVVNAKQVFKPNSKIKEAGNKFIGNSNIAAGLVGYMHFMTLVVQAHERSTHADDVIIGVGRENEASFGIGFASFRMGGQYYIRFAAGPAC